MNITALNDTHGIEGAVAFKEGPGALPCVEISNRHASALVSLYGAHVLSFAPAGREDLLWLSEASAFEVGKPIRGGIPLCFPWFGPSLDSAKPLHGFARLVLWDVVKTEALPGDETRVVLGLGENEATRAILPLPFKAELSVTVGASLAVSLTITNVGAAPFTVTEALHTYVRVSGVTKVGLAGLAETPYFDGTRQDAPAKQTEAILTISKEENRRYTGTTSDCVISDPGFGRKVRVAKEGSRVTVVWNPGPEASKGIGDMHPGGWETFLCVEAANAYDDAVALAPGASHTLTTVLSAE